MNLKKRLTSGQDGYTLVELLVAASVLLVGVLGAVQLIDGANARGLSTRAREGGTNLQRELAERARSVTYPAITPQGLVPALQAMPGLEDQRATAGWQVVRRGRVYTIETSVCTRDDITDGYGAHDTGSYCAGSQTGTGDRAPDDYRLVTFDVTWTDGRVEGKAHEQVLINNPGNAVGPAVTALTHNGPSNDVVSSAIPIPASLLFTVTTSVAPATVRWAVDGSDQGAASGSSTSWTFPWGIAGLVDGAYLVSARAFDAEGRSGPSRARTITLNRFLPDKVRGLAAGRSGSIVDIEWLANRERDIVGYHVYRRAGTGTNTLISVVCPPTPSATSAPKTTACYDPSPPNDPALVYTVVALDKDTSGATREGLLPSDPVTVTQTNTAPNPPTGLAAAPGTGGGTTLTWTAPATPDPDGDPIAFFRIYRDGQAYANRYDRTGSGTELTWTDPKGDNSHSYSVTAVDPQLAESTIVGPVSTAP
jgi:prepilin-type N-terminal cleavage/methylation domain-containing protein